MNDLAVSTGRWDIFCKVIDNFGDIGVCWRLASQLSDEFSISVRLYLDDVNPLTRLEPLAILANTQNIGSIEVIKWDQDTEIHDIGEVVVEAFACDVPHSVMEALQNRKLAGNPSVWINLEYLSAEDWVEGCHEMVSLQPSTGLKKTFFFPGFTPKTGGVLKEAWLDKERQAFVSDKAARLRFLEGLGVQDKDLTGGSPPLLVSLFAYENGSIASLMSAFAEGNRPVLCLVPQGRILNSLNDTLGVKLELGKPYDRGCLRLIVVPFMSQRDYDRLLWACDVNFVRGEDSFVRAQWAQKPFIWHIYPQEGDAHFVKLEAFIKKYAESMDSVQVAALNAFWLAWNAQLDVKDQWKQYVEAFVTSEVSHKTWATHLNSLGNLAANMVQFCQKPL